MTDTTTISKILPNPILQYTIDFYGRGGDVFLGEIPKKKAVRFSDWNNEKLRKIVDVHVIRNLSERLSPQIPRWAWDGEVQMFSGIDLAQPHEVVVKDHTGKTIFTASYQQYGLFGASNDNEIIDIENLDKTKSYLYIQDMFAVHERYFSFTSEAFDASQLELKAIQINGIHFIDELRHGEERLVGGLQDYHDARLVKIVNG